MSLIELINQHKLFRLLSIVLLSVVPNPSASAYGQSPEEIALRIQAVGKVCIAGEECDVASTTLASSSSDKTRDGETLYNTFCTACHAIGVANAPKFGNASDWTTRIEKGMNSLLSSAINGINAMPPKGTCSDCTDEEIKSAINYMLDNIK